MATGRKACGIASRNPALEPAGKCWRHLSAEGAKSLEGVEHTFKLSELAPKWYLQRNDEERTRLVKALGSNYVLSVERIELVYNEPFAAVALAVKTEDWLGVEDALELYRLES